MTSTGLCSRCGREISGVAQVCADCLYVDPAYDGQADDVTRANHWLITTLGALLCLVSWGVTGGLWILAGVLGTRSSMEPIIFLSPIVGTALPMLIRVFDDHRYAAGLWLLGITPLLGIFNFVLVFFLDKKFTGLSIGNASLLLGAIWAIPWLFYLKENTRRRNGSP
ncbi:MAG: hypothetical protein ACM3SV_11950 [Betaproteobacteria bacterium]